MGRRIKMEQEQISQRFTGDFYNNNNSNNYNSDMNKLSGVYNSVDEAVTAPLKKSKNKKKRKEELARKQDAENEKMKEQRESEIKARRLENMTGVSSRLKVKKIFEQFSKDHLD